MFAMIEIEQTAPQAWVGHVEAGEQVRRVSVRASSFTELVPVPSPPVLEEAVPAARYARNQTGLSCGPGSDFAPTGSGAAAASDESRPRDRVRKR
jgi:hypothetical protein